MIQFLRRVLKDITYGENLDLIVAIPLTLIIAFLGGLGIASVGTVLSATLATLGLIVIGFLATRYTLEKIQIEMQAKSEPNNTVLFLTEKPSSLKGMMKGSEEIWMAGLTLRTTTTENYRLFEDRVKEGAKICTLIVDQDRLDMKKVVKRFAHIKDNKNPETEFFYGDFKQTMKHYKDIRNSASNLKNVQIKFLDFVPAYSLYIFPKTEIGGVVFVELYGYQSHRGSIPRFQLKEFDNPEWYEFFVDQFNKMWNDAYDITLNKDLMP